MGILDNDTVIVDAILTKAGRQKLAAGQNLGIRKFSFGDTGVDYTLYNPNHPSGSDSYGSAITSLPMVEAVPHTNVFLRSKLYGINERDVQNFSYIEVDSIYNMNKQANQAKSQKVKIFPQLYPETPGAVPLFDVQINDGRGLDVEGKVIWEWEGTGTPDYDYPDPVVAHVIGVKELVLQAKPGQFTATRNNIGLEFTRNGPVGAAAAFAILNVAANSNKSG